MSKSYSESSSTCILCLCVYARSESAGEVGSPCADVIVTIISWADQFKVLIFHCGSLFYFLIQHFE